MTPELLEAMGKTYRLRHTVQRRVEYAVMICIFALVIAALQHFTTENLRPVTIGTLAIAILVGASAWPVALQHQAAQRRQRWLRAQEDKTTRILPNGPDPFDTEPPGLSVKRGRAAS